MNMNSEKDLGKALSNGVNVIEIEGDLAKKVIKIKAAGKVSWAVCIGALTVATAGIIATIASGGIATPVLAPAEAVAFAVAAPVLIPAVSTIGIGATASAIMIAVAAGGVGALNKLRGYKMNKISDTHIILSKR